jgi:hypothetical protein
MCDNLGKFGEVLYLVRVAECWTRHVTLDQRASSLVGFHNRVVLG